MTLDLRTSVNPGRACLFTYAVRWSGIPRKSRPWVGIFSLSGADLTGQCPSQFEMYRINICGIFETVRGQHGLPQSRLKTNESTVLASKWCAFLRFTWKYKQLAKIQRIVSIGKYLRSKWFTVCALKYCFLSHSLSKVKVSERWSRFDDARWTYGPVSVWYAPFWKVYINLGTANSKYWRVSNY